ncbi:MAG: bifunctional nuclease family protein [Anaerolineaceae bacterium]|nr:bifunctional nuclease family protein [Anaerolineaceae bacterium]
MTQMVEVTIDSVRVSLTNQQRIVMLREVGQERFLPIWIGPYEAEAITISLQEIEVARPQTHDLIIQMLTKLNGRLLRVEVVALKGDVFYGNLVVEMNHQIYNVDARPSDSIALAVRAHVPILVASEILNEAGITPELDIQAEILNESEPDRQKSAEEEAEETKKRLSVFEDFLQNVKLDDLTKRDSENDQPDEDNDQGFDEDHKPED